MGTTNTRGWLLAGKEIVARERAPIGVRDSARTGTTDIIHRTLKDLFRALLDQALDHKPAIILGAGMITSSLGLLEIDHVPAPAGEQELAYGMRRLLNPQITELPIWLVPGVRTGPVHPEISDLSETDVIRGEETLCVGLQQMGMLAPNSTLLNLGSHWKAITLNNRSQIASSFTTLSGELIHALQTHTVLSSAVPEGRLNEPDLHWLKQGSRQEKVSGLSRALFCVRILEQKFKTTAVQRSSFLLGAMVGCDLRAALENRKLGKKVVIAGSGAAAEAWRHFLEEEQFAVQICDAQAVENAFIAGLMRLAALAD
jgi:2-dehydro-3-deoxygalactonokinase